MSLFNLVIDKPWLKTGCTLGEAPIYDPTTEILHFVDIIERKVYHLNTRDTADIRVQQFEASVTALALRSSGIGLAGVIANGFALLHGDSSLEYLSKPLSDLQSQYIRFNDGACDSKGRWFAGTIWNKERNLPGQLWRFDPTDQRGPQVVDEGPFTDSNGLGFNGSTLYFTDSLANIIYQYDYDETDGSISHRRVFVDGNEHPSLAGSFPDGLCIDSLGGIWSARWGGSKIVRFSLQGVVDYEITLPTALNVTACCFGGVNNAQMFITTAHCGAIGGDATRQEKYPDSGHLFMADLTNLYTGGRWRSDFAG